MLHTASMCEFSFISFSVRGIYSAMWKLAGLIKPVYNGEWLYDRKVDTSTTETCFMYFYLPSPFPSTSWPLSSMHAASMCDLLFFSFSVRGRYSGTNGSLIKLAYNIEWFYDRSRPILVHWKIILCFSLALIVSKCILTPVVRRHNAPLSGFLIFYPKSIFWDV